MNFQAIINSPGIWVVSAFLVIISVSQAVVFMRGKNGTWRYLPDVRHAGR